MISPSASILIMPKHTTIAYNNRGNCEDYAYATTRSTLFAAIADYDIAIRLNPDYAMHTTIAEMRRASLGQHFAAIADYDIAIRLNPDDAKAYYNRGIAKALLNRTWEAKQDVRTALRLAKQAGDTSLITDIEKLLHLLE